MYGGRGEGLQIQNLVFTALISSVQVRNPWPLPQSPGFLSAAWSPGGRRVRTLGAGPQPALLSQRPGERGVSPSLFKKAPQATPVCSQGAGPPGSPLQF